MSENNENLIEFNGKYFFDDRLFVMHLCRGTISYSEEKDIVTSTIYHDEVKDDFVWFIATYWNCPGYQPFSLIPFSTRENALTYLNIFERTTPRISLSGGQLNRPISSGEYLLWKRENNMKEFDIEKTSFKNAPKGSRKELIMESKDRFERNYRRGQIDWVGRLNEALNNGGKIRDDF